MSRVVPIPRLRPGVWMAALSLAVLFALASMAQAQIKPFVGQFSGSAAVERSDGTTQQRDMSVQISETRKGFKVRWKTTTYKADGRSKEKSYEIDFVPSDRDGVFAAAMKRNVFGHEVQLDPMKGEPYVWGQINGDTLTIYSLFVDPDGGYEIQQFDRTLAEGGMELVFRRLRNGVERRAISTFLERQ